MGTIAEVYGTENSLLFPKEIAPFDLHIIVLTVKNQKVKTFVKTITRQFDKEDVDYLLDDRPASAGEKFAESDLMGIPTRIILSEKTIREGKIELQDRTLGSVKIRYVKIGDIISTINQKSKTNIKI